MPNGCSKPARLQVILGQRPSTTCTYVSHPTHCIYGMTDHKKAAPEKWISRLLREPCEPFMGFMGTPFQRPVFFSDDLLVNRAQNSLQADNRLIK